jgi:hypothetical protein
MSLAERAGECPVINSETMKPWKKFLDFWLLNLNGARSAFAPASQKPRRAGTVKFQLDDLLFWPDEKCAEFSEASL